MLKELKKSTPLQMGPYLSSKWISHHFFIDGQELKELLMAFNTRYFFTIGKMFTSYENDVIEKLIFEYDLLIANLKKNIIDFKDFKEQLPIAISKTAASLYLYSPKEGSYTIKIARPVLQLQFGSFGYSQMSRKIHLNSLGNDTIFWGFKLAYPQIFQDPKSNEILKVDASFENYSYFSLIRKWLREKTCPVKFIIDQEKIVTSLRIGKKCLPWIHLHPQLKKIGCELDYAH